MIIKRITGAFVALVLVAATAAWLFSQPFGGRVDAHAVAPAAVQPIELAAVDVATVTVQRLAHSLPMSGTLWPVVQATIKAKVSGEVLEINVKEGESVKQGDILLRIDTRNLQATYDSQAAALDKARADLELAKLNRDKNRSLLEKNYISKITYESTESAYAANVADVKLAEAMARLASINLQDALVRAPFSGVVAKRFVHRGEKVAPDVSLLTLVDLHKLQLQAAVPSSEVPSIKVGQRAQFGVSGFGTREFSGNIERINPMTEEGSRSIIVYVAVDNADGALRGGMFAQGALTLVGTEVVPAIPIAAVHQESGANYIYMVRNETIVRRPITLGLEAPDAGLVEVRDGLAVGDRLLATQIDKITPGTKIVMSKDGS